VDALGGEMAKAKTVYRYVKAKAKRSRKRAGKTYFGLNLSNVIDGGLAGISGQVAQRFIGAWGHPAATLGVGVWRKNAILQVEGSRELGALIGSMLPVIGGGQSPYAGRNY